MEFKDLAEERYSLRKFSDKPIEKEKLAAESLGLAACWIYLGLIVFGSESGSSIK